MLKQELYELANQMDSSDEQYTQAEKMLDRFAKKKYEYQILSAVRREKSRTKKKRFAVAAACLAVMAAVTGIFHNEVQAAIEQIRFSLSTALGRDMSRYSEIVHSSVSDAGYTITLEEVIVAQEELLLSYTIQRGDGQPVELPCTIHGMLYVNGEHITGGSGMSMGYLDEEEKILGCEMNHSVLGMDLSGKNVYELKFEDLEQKVNGNWDFKFEAEGSELFAETKSMQLGYEYALPDGNVITLDELLVNELKQQITFHAAREGLGMELELRAVDEKGRKVQFDLGTFRLMEGSFENGYIVEDGEGPKRSWIAPDAETLMVTLYGYQLPETDGEIKKDSAYQIGETLTLDLTKLR